MPQPSFDIEPVFHLVGWDTGAKAAPARLLSLLGTPSKAEAVWFALIGDQAVFSEGRNDILEILDFVKAHNTQLKFKKSPPIEAVKTALGEPEGVRTDSLLSPGLRPMNCEY